MYGEGQDPLTETLESAAVLRGASHQPWAVERPCQPSGISGESFAGLGCSAMSLRSVSAVPGRSHGSVATVSTELGRLPWWDGRCFRRSSTAPRETESPEGDTEQHTDVKGDKSLAQHFVVLNVFDVLGNWAHLQATAKVSKSLRPTAPPPADQQGGVMGKLGWAQQKALAFPKPPATGRSQICHCIYAQKPHIKIRPLNFSVMAKHSCRDSLELRKNYFSAGEECKCKQACTSQFSTAHHLNAMSLWNTCWLSCHLLVTKQAKKNNHQTQPCLWTWGCHHSELLYSLFQFNSVSNHTYLIPLTGSFKCGLSNNMNFYCI